MNKRSEIRVQRSIFPDAAQLKWRLQHGSVVSRLGDMAEIYEVDCQRVRINPGISPRRTLWIDQPDSAIRNITASNIAEGHGRLGTNEYRHFLGIARASNFELQTQLEIAQRLEFGNPKLIEEATGLSHEVGKMIYATLESLKK